MGLTIDVPEGTDLGSAIRRAFLSLGCVRARVGGEGTLSSARLLCHDQRRMTSYEEDFNGPVEILSLDGEATLRGSAVDLRIHIVLTGPDGRGAGGLLVTGGVPVCNARITLDPD